MITHSVFISHSSATKELARHIFYNAVANGITVWYDEGVLNLGDEIKESLRQGIKNSASFLLLHSKAAMDKPWVPFEMGIAKAKYEHDTNFRILTVKLDDEPLPDKFWEKFLYGKWEPSDQGGFIIRILETITGKKGILAITASAVLTTDPASFFVNQTATIAEHTRNYVLWYLGHIKNLMQSVVLGGHDDEWRDTLKKLLRIFLIESVPAIQGGLIPIGAGIFESVHGNRMRIPPRISIQGLPDRYKLDIVENNEVFTRLRIKEIHGNTTITHPVPLSWSILFDAEL